MHAAIEQAVSKIGLGSRICIVKMGCDRRKEKGKEEDEAYADDDVA